MLRIARENGLPRQFANWRGNPFPRHSKNAIARQGNLLDKLEFIELIIKSRRDTRPRVSETKSALDVPILFLCINE